MSFPIGFGLIALHFAIRTIESTVKGIRDEPVDETRVEGTEPPGADAEVDTDTGDGDDNGEEER